MEKARMWLIAMGLVGLIAVRGAENTESILRIKDQIPYDNIYTQEFETNLDSNLVNWYMNDVIIGLEREGLGNNVIPDVTDSILIQRLKQLSEETIIEFPFNEKVKSFINMYTMKRRSLSETMLGLSDYYFPIFEAELDKQNMPLELKYLPVIESALNPRAFSKAGASGLWQFVYGTGRFYKMDINSYIDERRDPVISTQRAVKYLKDMYQVYNDWFLVIAAYNCGPGNVNKAIRRSGGKKDYWEIYYRLPRETRGYVPAFIAAAYTMTYYEEHNLYPKVSELPRMTDTITISQPLHLKQVSEVLDIPFEMVRDLNPQYRRDYIPAGTKTYPLVLPVEKSFAFIDKQDEVFSHNKEDLLAEKRSYVAPSNSSYAPTAPTGRVKLEYTVKSGDNLGYISEWYNVGLSDLRYWNNVYRNTIRVGQKLAVYVPKGKEDRYKDINYMSFADKQASVGKNSTSSASAPRVSSSSSHSSSMQNYSGDYEVYRVQRGDNLYMIARMYPGVSAQNIMDLNGMKTANISPGMLLKIRPKNS